MNAHTLSTTSTTTPSPRISNSSDGSNLTSPNASSKNNGGRGTMPRSGQVGKLVNEFQQICDNGTNNDANNGICIPNHSHNRRHYRENTSSTSRQESPHQHRYIPRKYKRHNNTFTKNSIKRKNTYNSKPSSPSTFNTDNGKSNSKIDHDIQQQFFKTLTNDLITSGSVRLRSTSNKHHSLDPSITATKQIRNIENNIARQQRNTDNLTSKFTLGSSPPHHVILKKTNSEDEKVFKHQLSKTFEPRRPASPVTTFLANTAPAHSSVFNNKPSSSPSSPSSSPRALRASLNTTSSPSPTLLRRPGSPVVVNDLSQARAALNPVGLPLDSPSSPSSESSPASPISPKPLRPSSSLKFPSSPTLSSTESATKHSPIAERRQQFEEAARRHVSPIRSQLPSAFVAPPVSPPQSPTACSTPLSPSFPPTSINWTACKPQSNNNPPQNRHILSRPINAIGGVRVSAAQCSDSTSNNSNELNTSAGVRHSSSNPFNSPISSLIPPSPTITRIRASPINLATNPVPVGTATSIVASSPGSLSELSSGTSPSSFCSSISNSPHNASPLDLRNVSGLVPSVDNNHSLITSLSLDHNPRRSVESTSSFTVSPRESPCPSPCESPRTTKSQSPSESPRGWSDEVTGIPNSGWRSPTLASNSALNVTSFSPNLRASFYNHHRARGCTAVDLSPRSSPELLSPVLTGSATGRGRLDSYGRTTVADMGTRSREGSLDGRPREGSLGSPSRSTSEPFVPEKEEIKSPSPATNLHGEGMLTRSVSAWQLGKNGNEYGEEAGELFSDRTDLVFTKNTRTGARVVKAGTLDALVDVLTWQKQSDPAYIDAFLLTYASFVSPVDLLNKLIERYNQSPPEGLNETQKEEFDNDLLVVRLRICSVLKSWVDKYYFDFQKGSDIVESFVTFMESLKERGMEKVAGMIVRALYKKLDGGCGKKIISTPINPMPAPIIPKGESNLFGFDDAEIARQITLLEYESYCSIKPRECLNQAWNKANKEEESPNIVTMIRRSNAIPLWVATEIIKEDKLQRRVTVLKKFISIAEHCRQLNNFNAVMEIISGLNLTPVYRLRKTWDALPKKYCSLFEQLTGLMAPKGNFKVYREELHTKDPPCVPFLGRYLTDLTFIEESAKDVGEGMINFVTRMQLSVVIREIQQYQQTPYNLAFVPCIRDYLLKIYGFPEAELYSQSRMLEPPQQ